MVVALSEKFGLSDRNLIELDEHTLHSDIAAAELPGENNCAVAARAQLLGLVNLETPQFKNVSRNIVGASRHCDDVRLQLRLPNKGLGLVHNLFDGFLGPVIIAGL